MGLPLKSKNLPADGQEAPQVTPNTFALIYAFVVLCEHLGVAKATAAERQVQQRRLAEKAEPTEGPVDIVTTRRHAYAIVHNDHEPTNETVYAWLPQQQRAILDRNIGARLRVFVDNHLGAGARSDMRAMADRFERQPAEAQMSDVLRTATLDELMQFIAYNDEYIRAEQERRATREKQSASIELTPDWKVVASGEKKSKKEKKRNRGVTTTAASTAAAATTTTQTAAQRFPPCGTCRRTNHREEDCYTRLNATMRQEIAALQELRSIATKGQSAPGSNSTAAAATATTAPAAPETTEEIVARVVRQVLAEQPTGPLAGAWPQKK